MEALVGILMDCMEAMVNNLGESMVDTLEVSERSMVEVLGDMVGYMASWGQLTVSTPLAIMRWVK